MQTVKYGKMYNSQLILHQFIYKIDAYHEGSSRRSWNSQPQECHEIKKYFGKLNEINLNVVNKVEIRQLSL